MVPRRNDREKVGVLATDELILGRKRLIRVSRRLDIMMGHRMREVD